ncbi:putative sorting nexin isoform 1 [Operophtera brumata]|uniref:Putative sorting nexin isoform 1 n=1 Tax=Operophtera brumata TaxID=104452 RepID=A0A0L7LA73_OPEBR|nr:putative sorting nexin isoform 1 [Operophtera brumata]
MKDLFILCLRLILAQWLRARKKKEGRVDIEMERILTKGKQSPSCFCALSIDFSYIFTMSEVPDSPPFSTVDIDNKGRDDEDLFASAVQDVGLDPEVNGAREGMENATIGNALPSITATLASPIMEEIATERSNNIIITITEPQKIGEGMYSYVAYRVLTKTNMPIFSKHEFAVLRRFSDFLGLHEKLTENVQSQFVERRRAALERFLNRVGQHPVLSIDPDFREFLESGNRTVERRRSALERFLNRVGQHPVLSIDPDFREFLESDTRTVERRCAALERFLNRVGQHPVLSIDPDFREFLESDTRTVSVRGATLRGAREVPEPRRAAPGPQHRPRLQRCVERRRAALERFLNRVGQHPVLSIDPDFREFLESGTRTVSVRGVTPRGAREVPEPRGAAPGPQHRPRLQTRRRAALERFLNRVGQHTVLSIDPDFREFLESGTRTVERRRAALERFLNRVGQHPVLSIDPDFREFLESDTELPKATSTSALSGAGVLRLFNKVGETVNKITYKMDESDPSLAGERRELSARTHEAARACAALSGADPHAPLSRALSHTADLHEKLTKRRENKAKAELANRPEKIEQASNEIIEEFDMISRVIKKELERWEEVRVTELRATVLRYLEEHMKHQAQKVPERWEEVRVTELRATVLRYLEEHMKHQAQM